MNQHIDIAALRVAATRPPTQIPPWLIEGKMAYSLEHQCNVKVLACLGDVANVEVKGQILLLLLEQLTEPDFTTTSIDLSSIKHPAFNWDGLGKDCAVASLQTKSGQYRILSEQDYQKLYGLARDVARLRGGLRVVISAARAVQKHPDLETIQVLIESINLINNSPSLPIRDSFEPLSPEGFELEENDETILDPQQLDRLIHNDSVVENEEP